MTHIFRGSMTKSREPMGSREKTATPSSTLTARKRSRACQKGGKRTNQCVTLRSRATG